MTKSVYGIVFNATVANTITDQFGNIVPITGISVLGQTAQVSHVRTFVDYSPGGLYVPAGQVGSISLTLPDGSTPVILDNKFPFGSMLGPSNPVNPTAPRRVIDLVQPVGSPLLKSDSPFTRYRVPANTTITDLVRNVSFTTTLYYRPPGGIFIPVGNVTWGWGGHVTFFGNGQPNPAGSTFTRNPVAGNPAYTAAIDNSFFQSWQYTFNQLKEVRK